jgi:IclR family acetate operon transcriptional repressor
MAAASPPPAHPQRGTSDPRRAQRASGEAYYADRTLRALELLTFNDLSCPQIAASLQIHPRTARRVLLRLAADGYIEQTFDSRRRYRATLRLAALGCQVIAHARLPRVAAPYVAELHATTGALAHLFIPSYRGVACVVHGDGARWGRCLDPMLRELLPAHATAAGKVLLAFRQPWRDSVLANALPRYTDASVTSRLDLERSATQVRARGYAIDDGEYQSGVLAIAAPVFVGEEVPAALAVSGPRRHGDLVDALRERVMGSAAALTRALDQAEIATDDHPV